ncbi:MAG: 50S ribosomal protein L7ae [Lachnospiraceae bacterium]|jgi:ribosomal protein L7Ae-like RNA K-turn-binding protein|nr:50S ribosomal protein L7ae [Lachnospiraceae bacterium]
MKNDRILSLLGLAIKSGNLVSGEFMTEKAVKGRKAHLVIVSEEASDNTKKKFSNMCSFYEVPLYFYETMEELGHCIGKTFRASLAVTSEGLAKSIISKLECGQ